MHVDQARHQRAAAAVDDPGGRAAIDRNGRSARFARSGCRAPAHWWARTAHALLPSKTRTLLKSVTGAAVCCAEAGLESASVKMVAPTTSERGIRFLPTVEFVASDAVLSGSSGWTVAHFVLADQVRGGPLMGRNRPHGSKAGQIRRNRRRAPCPLTNALNQVTRSSDRAR